MPAGPMTSAESRMVLSPQKLSLQALVQPVPRFCRNPRSSASPLPDGAQTHRHTPPGPTSQGCLLPTAQCSCLSMKLPLSQRGLGSHLSLLKSRRQEEAEPRAESLSLYPLLFPPASHLFRVRGTGRDRVEVGRGLLWIECLS